MSRLAWILAAVVAIAGAAPLSAQEIGEFEEVRLLGEAEVSFELGNRTYTGELRLRAEADGISLIELVDIDGYLAGIREVPATWPEAALDAQAVAARTYLAWTLDRGRSSSASRYDFDICATTQCQVYAGTGAGDPRWVEAVARTSDEVLLFEGRPAQAMYFSTSGGRTEPIQDIFAGATPKPYLVGAESPDEPSPLVEWTVSMPLSAFTAILGAAGYDIEAVDDVAVVPTERGEGVWHLDVLGPDGVTKIPVADIRRSFNRHGPDLYPETLPANRPDGRRYPQTILSYRFDVTYIPIDPLDVIFGGLPADDRPLSGTIVFEGEGWGHHVGMSQFGALAMAERGEGYADILSHFYTGLEPEPAPEVLPDVVAVGLDWGESTFVVRADGPFTIAGDDRVVIVPEGGTWIFQDKAGSIAVISGDLLLDRLLSRISGVSPLF